MTLSIVEYTYFPAMEKQMAVKSLGKKENLLTVIVPSYNHEKYILQTLSELVKLETCKEIIIIDDKSNDNTIAIVKDFVKKGKYNFIKIIEKRENKGLVSSLNLGLKLASTEYIYFIASDDIPIPENIDYLVRYIKDRPNLKYVIGGALNYLEDENLLFPAYTHKHYKFFSMPIDKRRMTVFIDYPSPLLIQSTIFKVEALKSIGGWDEGIILDDYPLFVKLLLKYPYFKKDFDFIPEVVTVKYRHHSNNTHKKILYQYNMVKEALLKLAPDNLKKKALAYSLSYYLLVSLKSKDFNAFFRLLREISRKNIHYVLYKVLRLTAEKIAKKLQGK